MAIRRIALALSLATPAAGCSDRMPVAPSGAGAPPTVSFDRGGAHGKDQDGEHGKKKGRLRRKSTLLSNMPVTGTLPGGGTFSGLLTITSFAMQNGQLVASGLVTGNATQGDVVTPVTQTFTDVPANLDPPPACQILLLDLGPIHLDLLGLVLDLNQVNLALNAQPGPSDLLGNLLCTVTNLLTIPGAIAALPDLLNQVNSMLAGTGA